MRSTSLHVLLAFILSFGASAFGAISPPPPPSGTTLTLDQAKAYAKTSIPSWCHNVTKLCKDCRGNYYFTSGAPTNPADECWLVQGSLIDELSLSYQHEAWDYRPNMASAGCSPCGGGGASEMSNGLISAGLMRIHRFRDLTQRSSFGPGVYNQYDMTFSVARKDNGAWQVLLTDPALLAPLILRQCRQ